MNPLPIAILLAAFAQTAAPASNPPSQSDPTFPGQIKPQAGKDIRISTGVEGLLTHLPVQEGMHVADGQLLATIDDRQAKAAVEVARITLEAAIARAEDDIEETFARKAADVAYADWQADLAANKNSSDLTVVAEITLQQKKLNFDKATLQIEKAQHDQILAHKDAKVKKAELEAAKVELERRTIKAPFAGLVQTVYFHEGEWVNPGEPMLQLVQFDALTVECYVPAQEYDPIDVAGRRVTVNVHVARSREVPVRGRVVYVNQTVLDTKGGGIYLVRAEIQNKRQGDYWLIRPGLNAEMTIHVSEPPVEDVTVSAAK